MTGQRLTAVPNKGNYPRPRTSAVSSLVFLTLAFFLSAGVWAGAADRVKEQLRQRIEFADMYAELQVGQDLIHSSYALPLFYERRTYEPAWVTDNGSRMLVDSLVQSIARAGEEGLRPQDYHLVRIRELSRQLLESRKKSGPVYTGALVDLELLCTDAFLIYGSHLLSGRINPETIDAEWFANRRDGDLAAVVESAISSGTISPTLHSLLPPQQEYRHLRRALADYRATALNGGWELVPEGPALKKGDAGDRVAALRKRLSQTKDLEAIALGNANEFDEGIRLAVIRFQNRHGLEADGIVGAATLDALNVPVELRIMQMVTNLERWRWLPQDLGLKHVMINIANFELSLVERGQDILSMRVIVGRNYRRTPVFSDRITYLVFNPYWSVPPSLAGKDILPELKRNPNYLTDNDFEVFAGWGTDMIAVDPLAVNWNDLTAKDLPYRFRQKPGDKNALGKVKFMFPNQFNVYLHDTPARGLFAKTKRNFSSGCIRIEKPRELAIELLKPDPAWTTETVAKQFETAMNKSVRLPESVPIHILYWTAWAEDDGRVHFRDDIYERDKPLMDALTEEPPEVQ